jgi:hypothetical protein
MKKTLSVLLMAVVLSAVIVLMAVPTLAGMVTSAKCGTKIVQVGDTKDQVLAKCGQPTMISQGRRGGGEVWHYNPGSGKFTGIARFTGSKLTSIELGGLGYTQPTPKTNTE